MTMDKHACQQADQWLMTDQQQLILVSYGQLPEGSLQITLRGQPIGDNQLRTPLERILHQSCRLPGPPIRAGEDGPQRPTGQPSGDLQNSLAAMAAQRSLGVAGCQTFSVTMAQQPEFHGLDSGSGEPTGALAT